MYIYIHTHRSTLKHLRALVKCAHIFVKIKVKSHLDKTDIQS